MNPIQMLGGLMGGMQGGGGPLQLLKMFQGGMNPQAIIQGLIQQNPAAAKAWEQAQKMAQGKSPDQLQQMLSNMAQERGTSLENIKQQASQIGIKIPF